MYESFVEVASNVDRVVLARGRPVVCVQGLGFVGTAMAIAVAAARDAAGEPHFDVIGVDLPSDQGRAKADAINQGRLLLECNDADLKSAFEQAHETGNLIATTDPEVYALASVAVVDIELDVIGGDATPRVDFQGFRNAFRTLGAHMRPGALIVIETTVPPGTCEKVALPELAASLADRNLPPEALHLAHSYERVMPGAEYFKSIVDFWRVYAGATPAAADACERFLSKVINVADYPLTRLHSTTASETAKVLENAYRAVNIAFINEWVRFAEAAGIDLFEVLEAIRARPTHSNIRYPGFGVGGYCLTKDPLMGRIAAHGLFGRPDLEFPFSTRALEENQAMPIATLKRVRELLDGRLEGRRLLLLGVSYRQDVADTRYSPSEPFVTRAEGEGAEVVCHDPMVQHWVELDRRPLQTLPGAAEFDAIIFAVPHAEYKVLDLEQWLGIARPIVLDANNVLTHEQRASLTAVGCQSASVGRGV